MEKIILWGILFAPIILCGQVSWDLKTAIGVAYEHNIFNAPTWIENQSVDPVNSGLFHYTKIDLAGTYKIRKHKFKWSGQSNTEVFPTLKAANIWDWKVAGQYDWRLQKKMRISLLAQLRHKKNGSNIDDTGALAIPRSYQQCHFALNYYLEIAKHHQLKVQLQRTHKIYTATATSELAYQETGISLKSVQKIKQKHKKSSQFTSTIAAYQRFYEQYKWSDTFEEDENIDWEDFVEEALTERLWRYLDLSMSYHFYLTNKSRLKFALASQQRLDITNERFGYRQITPSVEWFNTYKSWSFKWKNAYTRRDFLDLLTSKDAETRLRYQYLRSTLTCRYNWKSNWSLQGSVGVVRRWSNIENKSKRSYRGYLNTRLTVGVVYQPVR